MPAFIAQQPIWIHLQQQRAEGRVPHAQLFCGPSGTGKLAMAISFAQSLLCLSPGPDGQPCGHCRGCAMSGKLAHPDLHFVFPVIKPDGQQSDPLSDQFIEQWRSALHESFYLDPDEWTASLSKTAKRTQIYTGESEAIVHKLSLVSSQGGYKVMIIWQPELMHPSCANKILKILEEPPQQTIFILVSNHPENLLDTITSRCQRTEFPVLSEADISAALIEQRGLSADVAATIAHAAEGSYTRALQLISLSEDEALFFELFKLLMRKAYARDIHELRTWSEQVSSLGREQQKAFLNYSQRLVRENFIANFRLPQLNFMNPDEQTFATRFAPFINESNVIGLTDELSLAQRDIEQNVNARMVFFDLALKVIMLLKR